VFGIEDCMGRVRGYRFDAVIGIGGVGRQAQGEDIDARLNWIGIGPLKTGGAKRGRPGPLVTFDHFLFNEDDGPSLRGLASHLARRMYAPHAPRYVIDAFTEAELKEIGDLLNIAKNAPPSKDRKRRNQRSTCRKRKPC
jgi:hypothetical protein